MSTEWEEQEIWAPLQGEWEGGEMTITLTKKEVEEARGECIKAVVICDDFLNYSAERCRGHEGFAYCNLCLKLTQFGEGGEDDN